MGPLEALVYSFLFGLLHGILPDEHTWPITFSYAIGSASGKEGVKAGLYFSTAFTVQRMLISELAYLALTPFLLSPDINGIVYGVVGLAMSGAGLLVLKKIGIRIFTFSRSGMNWQRQGRLPQHPVLNPLDRSQHLHRDGLSFMDSLPVLASADYRSLSTRWRLLPCLAHGWDSYQGYCSDWGQ